MQTGKLYRFVLFSFFLVLGIDCLGAALSASGVKVQAYAEACCAACKAKNVAGTAIQIADSEAQFFCKICMVGIESHVQSKLESHLKDNNTYSRAIALLHSIGPSLTGQAQREKFLVSPEKVIHIIARKWVSKVLGLDSGHGVIVGYVGGAARDDDLASLNGLLCADTLLASAHL